MSSGGLPSRWRVPLTDVRLDRKAIEAVTSVLESGWLSSGPIVEDFEAEFSEYVGTEHAIACASGTAAIELSYDVLGVRPGDEIIMPSLNFVAAANLAARRGARPVFADVVAENDLTLDPESIGPLLSPRTRAVMTMHYGGHPCRPEVFDVAAEAGVPVIEDAAHAPGAETQRGRCGSLGSVGCFSFYANKNLPLGEGGMVTTNDDTLAAGVRSLRSHGMTTTTWQRRLQRHASYDVVAPGVNARLDEPRAALGRVLLRELDAGNAKRGEAVAMYHEQLAGVRGVRPAFSHRRGPERTAHHLFAVVLAAGVDRDGVRGALADAGVQTSVHYPPIHRLSAFAAEKTAALPHTDAVADRLVTLPLHPGLGADDVEIVVDALRAAL